METVRHENETDYERTQQYNLLTRWLHSFRYKNVTELIGGLARQIDERPIHILEIGSAVAKAYEVLTSGFEIDYTGVEIDGDFCRIVRERFGGRPNFRMLNRSAVDTTVYREVGRPHVVLALETLEHVPEHDVVRIVEQIAGLSPRLFVCSVPVEVGPAIWIKNVGSLMVGYQRYKNRPWSEVFWAGLYQLDRLPPHGTGHAGFDWRWLAQTIRHNMRIREIRRSPFPFLPVVFACR